MLSRLYYRVLAPDSKIMIAAHGSWLTGDAGGGAGGGGLRIYWLLLQTITGLDIISSLTIQLGVLMRGKTLFIEMKR